MQPTPPILDYTDRPPDCRLILTDIPDGVRIVDPPRGVWHHCKWLLLFISIALLLYVGGARGVFWLIFEGRFTFPWKELQQGWIALLNLTAALGFVFVLSWLAGIQRVILEVNSASLTITTDVRVIPRTRTFARDQIRDIRAGRGSRIKVYLHGRRYPLSIMLNADPSDTRWCAALVRRALKLE